MLPSERWEVAGILGGILWAITLIVFVSVRIARRLDALVRARRSRD